MKNLTMTVFTRCFQKTGSHLTDLPAWIAEISGGRYKDTVERIQQLRAAGDDDAADKLKQSLPALVPAGNCMHGRQVSKLKDRTGVAMFDQDHMTLEQLHYVEQVLRRVPWVMAGHVTSSGRGYRSFVDLGLVHPDRYRDAYRIVSAAIEHLTGVACDASTCDLCRLTLTSYDPHAFFHPEASRFPYDDDFNPLNYVPVTPGEDDDDFHVVGGGHISEVPFSRQKQPTGEDAEADGCATAEADGSFAADAVYSAEEAPVTLPSGDANDDPDDPSQTSEEHKIWGTLEYEKLISFIDHFILKFVKNHEFVKGNRHRVILQLGRFSRWSNLNRREFEVLKQEVVKLCPGLPLKEYLTTLEWGYNNSEVNPQLKRTRPSGHNGRISPAHARVSNAQKGLDTDPLLDYGELPPTPSDDPDDRKACEKELLARCPLFPEEVYQNLPSILERGLVAARTYRERDMLLMAMITNLSACLPGTHMLYARRDYSPHLYFAAVAEAGSGKGVVSLAANLGARIDAYYAEENRRNMQEYRRKLFVWETERHAAQKEGREPNWELQPDPYRPIVFLLPPNTSKSQFMLSLEAAGSIGTICNTTEMDAFAAALGSDCGHFAAELRMIFHHETVGQNYKIDGRAVVVRKPRFALCMSGTQMQLVNFVANKEDGMYSRMALLTGEGASDWISASPDPEGALDAGALFDALSEDVYRLFRFSESLPLEVFFTPKQWKEHDRMFGLAWRSVALEEGEGNLAIVGRHGLIQSRIAQVFTALRRYEAGFNLEKMECTDEDFHRALMMANCLMEHSLTLSTMLPNYTVKREPITYFHEVKGMLDAMPDVFMCGEFLEYVERVLGKSERSARRALLRLMNAGFLLRVAHGKYMKVSLEENGL